MSSSIARQEREKKGHFGPEDAVSARVAASTLDFLVSQVEFKKKESQLADALLEQALVTYNTTRRAIKDVRENVARSRQQALYVSP